MLASAGAVLTSLIRWLLGDTQTSKTFLQENSAQISAFVPLAVMWGYYGRILSREVAALADLPRRAALRRLYITILALLGLSVMLAGLYSLVDSLVQLAFSPTDAIGSLLDSISGAISALLVGLPLWLVNWRGMQTEAARKDDAGDHARRSVIRKAYLYFVLFLLVIAGMVFAGRIFYTLFNAVLSQRMPEDFGQEVIRLLLWLAIDLVFLLYHWMALRSDSQMAQQTLGNLHAAFPTLLLVEEEEPFAESFLQAIHRLAPKLPVAISALERGAPDETMLGAKMVLMPVAVALDPPESYSLVVGRIQRQAHADPAATTAVFVVGTGR